MNWERVKNFLIVLFVCINIFLVFFMFGSVKTDSSITKAVVRDTVSLLNANGITIDSKIIPLSVDNPGLFDVVPINVKSTYTAAKPLTGDNADDEIRKALKALGISDFVMYPVNDSEYFAMQKINGHFIFDSGISATVEGDNISLWGVWYKNRSKPKSSDNDMLPITAVLIDFMNNPDRDSNVHNEIVSVQVGYCVPKYDSGTEHLSMPAVQGYSITTSDGTSFLYDATSGTYLRIR